MYSESYESIWKYAVKNNYFRMFRFCAIPWLRDEICEQNNLQALKLLYKHGLCQGRETEMLDKACILPSIEFVRFLLQMGAKPSENTVAKTITSVALYGSRDTAVEILNLLFYHGVDKRWNRKHNSAIQMACDFGFVEMVGILIKNGMDLNESSPLGKISTSTGSREIIKMLVENGAEITPGIFQTACADDANADIVEYYLSKNPMLSQTLGLLVAVEHQSKNIVKIILQNGGKVIRMVRHAAYRSGNVGIVALIEKHARNWSWMRSAWELFKDKWSLGWF
jgi:hypothetical protein